MHIAVIDPADDETLSDWLAVRNAATAHEWPEEPALGFDEARGFSTGFGTSDTLMAVARDDIGEAVGCYFLWLPREDNVWSAGMEDLSVLPEHRRRGIGTALAQHAISETRSRNRSVLRSGSVIPLEGAPGEAEEPSRPFAKRMGFEEALTEIRRDLQLPVDLNRLRQLESEAAEHAGGYRIVTFEGRCPDDLVEGMLELNRMMSTDAPVGEMDVEEESWTEERLRKGEETIALMGTRSFQSGAVHEDSGRLVAITIVGVNKEAPELGRQWLTVVSRHHRGHRLGLLVKAANVRAVMEGAPQVKCIQTFNAGVNSYMIAVNEQLGFEVKARSIHWQKKL